MVAMSIRGKTVILMLLSCVVISSMAQVVSRTVQGDTQKVVLIPAPLGDKRIARMIVPSDWSQGPLEAQIQSGDKKMDIRVAHFATPMSRDEITTMLAPILGRTPPERAKAIEFNGFVGVSVTKLPSKDSGESEVYCRIADGTYEFSIIATYKGSMPLGEYFNLEKAIRTLTIVSRDGG
jgi:hypothetical protein